MTTKQVLSFLFPDLFILFGFAGVFYGIYSIYPPAAYIVCGSLAMIAFWPKSVKKTSKLPEIRGK
jgi:hypothetical protein